jgi:hypothetical protein
MQAESRDRLRAADHSTHASLLSVLSLYNSFPASAYFIQDDIGHGFPDEGVALYLGFRDQRNGAPA